MKKTIAFILVIILVCTSAFSAFDYKLDLFSFDPLHKEYMADKNSPNLMFNYIYNFSGFPDHVYQDAPGDKLPDPKVFYLTSKLAGAPFMGQFKLGENMSFLRNTFYFDNWLSPISFDISFQALLNLLLEGEMADMIGYDGVFFYGATMSIADVFSIRFGGHHYCNHYGDAILKRIDKNQWKDFWVTYKYVRMDALTLGLSVEPIDGIRVYGEYNWLPKNIESWRPVIFRPSWIDISVWDQYPEEYQARIINFGIELSYPIFPSLGKTTLAYDCHMYEEGKIVYKDENGDYILDPEQIKYDPDRPWKFEHGVVINQEFNDYLSLEIGYHYGRSPFNMFYFIDDASWMSVGLKFNPNQGISVVDTRK